MIALPPDAYPAHEHRTSYADESVNGAFQRAIGMILYEIHGISCWYVPFSVRGACANLGALGPSDELMILQRYFKAPVDKKAHPRVAITHLHYLADTRRSSGTGVVRNDCLHPHPLSMTYSAHAVPKYLASFHFAPCPRSAKATHVTVSLSLATQTPFFSAILTPRTRRPTRAALQVDALY
jgi:hypothetical protein